MKANNSNNVSVNDADTIENQGSRLILRHVSQTGTKRKSPYRNNHHPQESLETMNEMRMQNVLCDVTLVADSVEIPVHKTILASCSPYFFAMFNSLEGSKQERITLKEVDHQTLVLLIDYAYTSKVTVTEENVQALLPAANFFQLKDVRDACCQFLQAQLNVTNCLRIRGFADIHGCLDLLVNSESYIQQHFLEVVKCGEVLSLTHQQLSKLISSDRLSVPSEEKVFEFVISWVQHDLENRRKHLASIMEHVRLPLISKEYLVQRVKSEQLIDVDLQCKDYLIEALEYHLLKRGGKTNFRTPRTKPRERGGPPKALLVVGGDAPLYHSVECFDFKAERWYQVAEMPTSRIGAGVTALNGKVYVVGGSTGSLELQTVDVYDPVLDEWTSCANMNVPRSHLGVAVLDNLIYAVGGSGLSISSASLNTAEVFDTKKQSWEMISPMSISRSGVGVAVLNYLLYAVGGYDNASGQSLSYVECYHTETDTWLRVPDMSCRRRGVGVGVLDGILYAVGGSDGQLTLKSVEAYDPDKNTWTPVADMSVRRTKAGVVAMNGLLYVVGGSDGIHLSSVEVYNPEKGTWSMLPSCMSIGRNNAGVVILDKSIIKVI